MKSGRGNDLKERLKALNVSEPLKLNRDGMAMKPPPERKEVPQFEAPPDQLPQSELTKIEATQHKVGVASSKAPALAPPENAPSRIEVPRNDVAQIEVPHKDTPQNKATQIEAARSEVPQFEGPLNKANRLPQFERPQNEAPQREASVPRGFFKLSHAVFTEPLFQGLSGDCFRLFLWLSSRAWRYPTSEGTVRASIGYIEGNTGSSHATISRGLKTLKEKGLISIVEVDFKKGNIWQVSSLACAFPSNDDLPPRNKLPQNEATQNATEASSKGGSDHLKSRQPLPQNEGDLRSIKKVKNIKEAPKARTIISVSNPEQEVSIEQRQAALETFEESLGESEKETVIKEFISREYPHGYFPPMKVVRMLVASDWFQSRYRSQELFARGAS